MNSAKCSMSASVTRRGPATTVSPIRSSASDLRNGWPPSAFRSVPGIQWRVTADSTRGLACTAVRCMWCSTPRMPPISSPPPARPGPPCTSAGSGDPCPVDSAAVLAVQHEEAAVPGRQAEDDVPGEGDVSRDDRAGQAAPAAGREIDHLSHWVCPGSR